MSHRYAVAGDPESKTGRIQHRRYIVNQRCKRFQLLANASIVQVPADIAENVGPKEHVVWHKPLARLFQELRDGTHAVLFIVGNTERKTDSVREPHVVELNFIESVPGRLHSDIN